MMELVNGIPCFNCTDVERAKKSGGEDPNAIASTAGPRASSRVDQARIEARERIDEAQKSRQPLNENRPLGFGERGTAFNILV
jgi:hypothetical protein